jgi:hypothetical protein
MRHRRSARRSRLSVILEDMQSSIPVADVRIGYLLMAIVPALTKRGPTTMYGRPFVVHGLRKAMGESIEKQKIKVKVARQRQFSFAESGGADKKSGRLRPRGGNTAG